MDNFTDMLRMAVAGVLSALGALVLIFIAMGIIAAVIATVLITLGFVTA